MKMRFDGVWGQEKALAALARNFENGRVASAYLFAGPRGTGKTTAALIFAKALLCAGAAAPCGVCRPCKMAGAGSHPDFIHVYLDGAKVRTRPDFSGEADEPRGKEPIATLRMAEMRKIIGAVSMKSYMGGKKVLVIEEPDQTLRYTANAFLKTLEEPPGDTVIILVSSNWAGLLPTIVSRCRMVRFVPMVPEALAKALETERGLAPGEALAVARLAEGRPGAALGGGMDRMREIDAEARDIVAALPDIPPEDAVRFAERWKERRADLPLLLDRIMEALRAIVLPVSPPASGTIQDVASVYRRFPAERAVECFEAVLAARPRLVFNPNIQLFLESLVFGMQLELNNEGRPFGTSTD